MENIIIAADINVILKQSEKRGGSLVKDPIREQVDELIFYWDLTDIVSSEGNFTLTNKRYDPEHIASRLDKLLV